MVGKKVVSIFRGIIIYAETVYENDKFEFELGLNPSIKHKPSLKDRSNPIE